MILQEIFNDPLFLQKHLDQMDQHNVFHEDTSAHHRYKWETQIPSRFFEDGKTPAWMKIYKVSGGVQWGLSLPNRDEIKIPHIKQVLNTVESCMIHNIHDHPRMSYSFVAATPAHNKIYERMIKRIEQHTDGTYVHDQYEPGYHTLKRVNVHE